MSSIFTRVCKRGKELRSRRKWRLYRELSSGHLGDPSEDDEENKNPGAFIIQGYCTAPFWSPKKKNLQSTQTLPPYGVANLVKNPYTVGSWAAFTTHLSSRGASVARSIQTLSAIQSVSLSLGAQAPNDTAGFTPHPHTQRPISGKKKDEFLFFPIEIYPLWKFSYTHNGLWWKDNDLKKKKKEWNSNWRTTDTWGQVRKIKRLVGDCAGKTGFLGP